MAIVSPTSISALPTPPSTSSPSDFDAKADAFLGALPGLQAQVNAISTVNYGNATDAYNSATTAAAQAAIATVASANSINAMGAPAWVSGTTYAVGAAVWSPSNYGIYRRITAGAGTTDPSIDPTNWAGLGSIYFPTANIVTGTSVTASTSMHYILTNVAATTVTLPPSPVLGDLVYVTVANDLTTNVIARNGKLIMSTADDVTLNSKYASVLLRYINLTVGWRFI